MEREGIHVLVVLALLLVVSHGIQGQNVRVFGLQQDIWESPRDDVYIRFNMSNQDVARTVTEFTICSRVYYTSLTALTVLLSYASADTNDNAIMMYVRDGEHSFRYNNKPQSAIESISVPTVLRQWRLYCHVLEGDTYTVYVDGVAMANSTITVEDRVLVLNGTFVVGQEQDGLDKRYNRFQILKGYVTQFNFWSYGLDPKTIADIAACKKNVLGDVFSSDRNEVELINADVRTLPMSDFCSSEESFLVFPEFRTFEEASELCHLLGSELYAPSTFQKNYELHNLTLKYDICGGNFNMWIGATDEKEEGVWRKISDDSILTDLNFKPGQPDNIRSENCMIMSDGLGVWADFSCWDNYYACAPCEDRLHVPIFLRGICVPLKTETMFEILGYSLEGKPFFHGYHGLVIHKTTEEQWTLHNTVTNTTQAYLNMSSGNLYPTGKHRWTLTESICDESIGSTKELSISTCEEGEYMCNNGECIPLDTRCDAKDDCSDETDEDNCSILRIPEDYRSFKPPKNIDNSSLPLQPLIKVEFLRFLSIEDVKESIHLEFMIELSWPDSRVKYLNLRHDTLANQLSLKEVSDIWRPKINFPNIKDGALKLLGENLYVLRQKQALPTDFNAVEMDAIYGGDAAMIVQQQHYSGSFVCVFGVFYYPFDIQRCSILVQFSSISKELVAFSPTGSEAVYLQSKELPTYFVSEFSAFVPGNQTRLSMVQVGYTLTRRYTLIVLSLYLPSLMLLAIGYSTLYVKVNLLEVRLVVALTTLLVLYTFFNQASSSLPQTAYVKLIDVWFFFCTIFLFFIIIIHVFVEKLDENVVMPFGNGVKPPQRFAKLWDWIDSAEKFLALTRNYIGPVVIAVFFCVYFSVMFVQES